MIPEELILLITLVLASVMKYDPEEESRAMPTG
jgi:hypothetical protein